MWEWSGIRRVNHQTVLCEPIQWDGKGFYFCMDKDITMKSDDVFLMNSGSHTVQLLNSDGDCYVLDKNFTV